MAARRVARVRCVSTVVALPSQPRWSWSVYGREGDAPGTLAEGEAIISKLTDKTLVLAGHQHCAPFFACFCGRDLEFVCCAFFVLVFAA